MGIRQTAPTLLSTTVVGRITSPTPCWISTGIQSRYASTSISSSLANVQHWFYDFNMTANARATLYTPAGAWPLWQNITPPEVYQNETAALLVASGARYLLGKYAGLPSVASLLYTGLNWDFPNSWPPHACMSQPAHSS